MIPSTFSFINGNDDNNPQTSPTTLIISGNTTSPAVTKATLTTSEFNEFCAKVDTLESKGYDLSFTVDRTPEGNFDVEILGEHDIEKLDELSG